MTLAPPPRDRRLSELEAVIREQIGKIEQSYYHHEIERDGWLGEDECYRKVVNEAVRAILEADRRAAEGLLKLAQSALMVDPATPIGKDLVSRALAVIRSALGRDREATETPARRETDGGAE